MDLQTRKLNAIEYLIGLEDEQILSRIESIISEPKRKKYTEEELIQRAEEANEDYKSGRYRSQEELEEDSKKW